MQERYYSREQLVGKEVYDSKAERAGSVVDLVYSIEGKPVLVVEKESRKFFVPFDVVQEIGDKILLKSKVEEIEEKLQIGFVI